MKAYARLLDERPYITRLVTSSVLFGLGDALSQYAVFKSLKKEKLEFDFKRNFKSFAFGGTIAGPLFICQYLKVMPYLFPGEGLLIAAKKVAYDQTLWTWFFLNVYFFTMAKFDGRSNQEAVQSIKKKFFPTLWVNWQVWPAINFLNFAFIPQKYHILLINVVSVFWTAFLSYKNAGQSVTQQMKEVNQEVATKKEETM